MENQIKTDRSLINIARFISMIFTPFTIPTGAFLILFLFSYLQIMPMGYKLTIIVMVFCFTIVMPVLAIYLFRVICGLSSHQLNNREKRFTPYLIMVISYAFCLIMIHRLRVPWFLTGIVLSSLLMMIVFFIVNLKWKLSEHMGGVGAVIGGLIALSPLFGQNPVWWLCLFILLAGLLGSARIILGHHTLGEIIFGLIIGIGCSLVVFHPMLNSAFHFILI